MVLIPLIWTVLFHRRWESACVLIAIVVVEVVVSVVQSAPDAVIVRRVLLWAALGALLAVAAHGLRDRIQQSLAANARLQERIGELMVVQDRDRLAADLQSSVVQRIFAAGLRLQGVLSLTAQAEVRQRVESSVTDLDDAIRLLRQAIFGLERRLDRASLRQQVLRLCAGLSPVPEITFAGPVDDALLPAAAAQLVEMLRVALRVIGPQATQTSLVCRGRRGPSGRRRRHRTRAADSSATSSRPGTFPRCSTRPTRRASPSRSSRWPAGPSSPGVSRAGPALPRRQPPPDASRPADPADGRKSPRWAANDPGPRPAWS